MTDHELLELSAKAAGIALHFINGKPKEVIEDWCCNPTESPLEREFDWNPLTSDGDALRLAVKLEIPISPESMDGTTWICRNDMPQVFESHNDDPYAATRRAIVRAAAKIGKTMS